MLPNNLSRFHETPLFCVNWWRICLDDCQSYLNETIFTILSSITSVNKWAMTGMPIKASLKGN